MAPLAPDGDFELVAGGHNRSRAGSKGAHRGTRPVVHAKDGLHGKFVKQPVLDHFASATTAFLCGLENQINRAIKIAVLGKMFGSSQQHGGVSIMAASMHLALVFAGMREGVELLHGQCIHVGAQTDTPSTSTAITSVHDADHTCGAHTPVNGDAPFGELLCHHIGRAHLLKTQLRVCMDVFANSRNAGCVSEDGVNEFHAVQSSGS